MVEPKKETERSEGSPIVALRHNERALMFSYAIMIIGLLYAIFGAIIPVLSYGSYEAVYAPHNKTLLQKIIFFYISLIGTPFFIFFLFLGIRVFGVYEFYEDRLQVKTYWSRRRLVVPYQEMHVRKDQTRIMITRKELPGWSHPWDQFITKFIDGLAFSVLWSDFKVAGMKSGVIRGWENPEDGPKALEILRTRALSFKEV